MKKLALFITLFSCVQIWAAQPQNDLALFKQLADRWMAIVGDANFPEFLKNREDEEPIDQQSPLPAAESQALLKADKDSSALTARLSDLIDPVDGPYYGLTHQMSYDRLIEYLRTGAMDPRTGRFGNNDEGNDLPGVYMELNTNSNIKTFKWGPAELDFSYALLDRRDYYINPSWNFGHYDMYSASPAVKADLGRVKFYIQTRLAQIPQNEFVFTQPVTTEHLAGITVHQADREKLIMRLKAEGVPLPPGWKNWEDGIFGK